MKTLKITSENFEQEVLNSKNKILIDFYADWCGPCKMMSPIIEEIAEQVDENIKIGKINIDENQDIAVKYNVMSIPTFIVFKDGKVEKTLVGVRSKDEILEIIK